MKYWAHGLIRSFHLNHTLILFYTRLILAPVFEIVPGVVLLLMSGGNLLHNSYFHFLTLRMWFIKMLPKLFFHLLLQLMISSVGLFLDALLTRITVQRMVLSAGPLWRQEDRWLQFLFKCVHFDYPQYLTTPCAIPHNSSSPHLQFRKHLARKHSH